MIDIVLTALIIAICGVTWIRYLLDPDGLFNFFPDMLEQSLVKAKLSSRLSDRITWVLLECEKCFSGQVALWTYLIMTIQGYPYRLIEHLLLIVFSIFFAGVINTILRFME